MGMGMKASGRTSDSLFGLANAGGWEGGVQKECGQTERKDRAIITVPICNASTNRSAALSVADKCSVAEATCWRETHIFSERFRETGAGIHKASQLCRVECT